MPEDCLYGTYVQNQYNLITTIWTTLLWTLTIYDILFQVTSGFRPSL